MAKRPNKQVSTKLNISPPSQQTGWYSSFEGAIQEGLPLEENQVLPEGLSEEALQDPAFLLEEALLNQFKKYHPESLGCLERAYKLFLIGNNYLGAIRCLIENAWIRYDAEQSDREIHVNRLLKDAEEMLHSHSHESGINEVRARLLHYKGLILYREGHFGDGVKHFKLAKTFCAPDGLEAAKIQDSLGVHYERTGDFRRATHCLLSALEIKKKLATPHEKAITSQILGRLYLTYEDYEMAYDYLQFALNITEMLGDQKRAASLKNDLIKLFIYQNESEKALELIEQIEKEKNVKDVTVIVQTGMTRLYRCYFLFSEQQYEKAINIIDKEVVPLFKRHRYHRGYAVACRLKGRAKFQQGHHLESIELLGEAISLFKEGNLVDELAKTHFELGKIYYEMSEKKLALASFLESLKLAEFNGLSYLTSYIEDEIYRTEESQWSEIVQKRANHERIFDKEHTLLDALSALSETEESDGESNKTNSLVSLLRVGQAVAGERDLDRLLMRIKDETERALNADRCTVFLYDRENNELWSKVASGLETTEELRFPAHLGIAGYVTKTGETLNIKHAYEDPRFNKDVDKKTGYKTENLICMPMKNRRMEIIGVFQVLNKRNGHFEKVDEDLLMAIAATAGVAIENAQLAQDQKVAFESFIKTLSSTIDARDPITAGHSERVAEYSILVGEEIDYTGEDMEALKYAALLHDIGKIGIKEEILIKDGRLTEKEYRHIQKHAFYTYEILKNIRFEKHLQKVPEIAASHHEKMDGSGYFRGLKENTIPMSGRILAVCDVFDAITSRRHYRNRMPFDKVIQILVRDSGTHFDPDCIEAFLNIQLHNLANVLLMDKFLESPKAGLKLLKDIDHGISVREYAGLIGKEKMSKGEAVIHKAFYTLYHQESMLNQIDLT